MNVSTDVSCVLCLKERKKEEEEKEEKGGVVVVTGGREGETPESTKVYTCVVVPGGT